MKKVQKKTIYLFLISMILFYSLSVSVSAESMQNYSLHITESQPSEISNIAIEYQNDFNMFADVIIKLMRDSTQLIDVSNQKNNKDDVVEKLIDMFINKIISYGVTEMPPSLLLLRDEYKIHYSDNDTLQRLNILIKKYENIRSSEQIVKVVKELEDKRFIIKYKDESDRSKVYDVLKDDIKSLRKINKNLDTITVNGRVNQEDIFDKTTVQHTLERIIKMGGCKITGVWLSE